MLLESRLKGLYDISLNLIRLLFVVPDEKTY